MKNIGIIICSLLFIISCKSDDDSDSANNGNGNNKMTYKGNEIALNGLEFYDVPGEGVILYIFEDDTFYNGIQVNFSDSYFNDLDGNYTFQPNDENYDPDANFWAGNVTNHNTEAIGEEIIDGQIRVQRNGNSVSVDFEMETEQGTAIGHYEGFYEERL